MSFLYFAYGSNLLRQRLHLSNPSAKFVAVAELKDHSLDFSCLGMDPTKLRWRGGAATIKESPGLSVWGCVWRLGNEHKSTLDSQEIVYDAKDVKVTAADGRSYTCRTYQLPSSDLNNTCDNRPSSMYMDIILKGAQQNDIPKSYIDYLRGIETNGHMEKNLELYTEILKLIDDNP